MVQTEFSCYCVFCRSVRKICIELGKCTHRDNLQCFPYRRQVGFTILTKMLGDKIIMRARYFFTNTSQICYETCFISSTTFVHKPKCTEFKRKVFDYFCTDSNFNCLDGSKQQRPKLFVKRIEGYNISKTTVFSELMCSTVSLKMSPITCKTEITDGVKNFNSLFDIVNEQTSFSENANLLLCGYGLMRVSNSHK